MKRFKHLLILFFLITCCLVRVHAQNLVLCESYDEQGVASGIYPVWEIQADGGNVYILYNQTSALADGSWYLYLDYIYDDGDSFEPYETFAITPEYGKTWFVYDYKFTEAGKYRASVVFNGTALDSINFTIAYAEGVTPLASDEIDTYYYENSFIVFCQSLDDAGYPVGESTEFSMNGTGSVDVTVYLSNNGLAFKTNKMYVDVYDEATNEIWNAFTIDVEPDWDYVKFVQKINKPGRYFIDFYSADDIFINTSATLTVTE